MASTSDLFGGSGGGAYEVKFFSGRQVASSGLSGVLLTFTPASGNRVAIENLYTSDEPDISISVGGVEVINGTIHGSPFPPIGGFVIGNVSDDSDGSTKILPRIIGGIDEVITVTKTSGSTVTNIWYSWSEGV